MARSKMTVDGVDFYKIARVAFSNTGKTNAQVMNIGARTPVYRGSVFVEVQPNAKGECQHEFTLLGRVFRYVGASGGRCRIELVERKPEAAKYSPSWATA